MACLRGLGLWACGCVLRERFFGGRTRQASVSLLDYVTNTRSKGVPIIDYTPVITLHQVDEPTITTIFKHRILKNVKRMLAKYAP